MYRGKLIELGSKFGYWVVIDNCSLNQYGKRQYLCKCRCGFTKVLVGTSLTHGKSTKCQSCAQKERLVYPQVEIGKQYNYWTVLRSGKAHPTSGSKFYWCKCVCGIVREIDGSRLRSGRAISCSCIRNINSHNRGWGGNGEISGTFWSSIIKSAQKRKIDFSLAIEEAWALFLRQHKKCALTGLELVMWSKRRHGIANGTASLDRIDSNKGYVLDNVQWVHKDVNRMKWHYDESYFLGLCQLIVDYNNRKGKISLLDPTEHDQCPSEINLSGCGPISEQSMESHLLL